MELSRVQTREGDVRGLRRLVHAPIQRLRSSGIADIFTAVHHGRRASAIASALLTDAAHTYAHDEAFIQFGTKGDLAKKLVIPSILELMAKGGLTAEAPIVLADLDEMTPEEFRKYLDELRPDIQSAHARENDAIWKAFCERAHYVSSGTPSGYEELGKLLDGLDQASGESRRRVYKLDVPPAAFPKILEGLSATGQLRKGTTVLIEKPFGTDLATAQALSAQIAKVKGGSEVLLVDHFLMKTGVRELQDLRMTDHLFNRLFKRRYVKGIRVHASEMFDAKGRAGYYDKAGAMKDMIEPHLLEVAAVTMMRIPRLISAASISAARAKALSKFKQVLLSKLTRGQYEGYRSEPGVNPSSDTETFAGLQLFSRMGRWRGVPIQFWSGKALDRKVTEVVLELKRVPRGLAKRYQLPTGTGGELRLIIDDSNGPTPRFCLTVGGKQVDLAKPEGFSDMSAYSRVILLAMEGDKTGSPTIKEPIQAWRILKPAVDAQAGHDLPAPFDYARGLSGEGLAASE